MDRRDLLKLAAAAPLAALLPRAKGDDFPGRVIRMREPANLEYPFSELKTFATPTEQHYVRNHFAAPAIDAGKFRLGVEGAVEKPLTLNLDELAKLGEVERPATLECAGNDRVQLIPQTKGLQWGSGAVSTADWAGVPLAAVLERVGVKKSAIEVIFVGADKGTVTDSPGIIHFDRSLPLAKARASEVLLATRMNGQPLTPLHGAPLRLIVPGWYGMASVKWLDRIVVSETPHDGFWQTIDYAVFTRPIAGLATLKPVTVMQPKASIARPAVGARVAVNKPLAVEGAAWGGEAIAKVELSSDGGKTWSPARFTTEAKPFCWRLWRWDWTPTARGPASLIARATDAKGQTQPEKRDTDRRSYMINHYLPAGVVVG